MDNPETAPPAAPAKGAKAAKAAADAAETISAVTPIKVADDKRLLVGAETIAAAKARGLVLVVLTTSRLLDAATQKAAVRGSIAVVPENRVERLLSAGRARIATDREVARAVDAGREPVRLVDA